MKPTIQDLFEQLEAAGFSNLGGKGNHRSYRHPRGINITLNGRPTHEARPFQIKETSLAIEKTRNEKQ